MNSARDMKTGQYTDNKMEKLCTCGHRLGVHLAAGDRGCINHEVGDSDEPCGCEKFKKARR